MRISIRSLFVSLAALVVAASVLHAQPFTFEQVDGLTGGTANCVARDAGGRLYLGSIRHLFTSDDNGVTWQPRDTGLNGTEPHAIVIDSSGAAYTTLEDLGGTGGVFRSLDRGVTWTRIVDGIPRNARVLTVAVDSAGMLLAGTIDIVYRSVDRGDHWTAASMRDIGGGSLSNLAVRSIQVAPSGTLLATSSKGILRSVDAGVTWLRVSIAADRAASLLCMVHPSGTLYAAEGGAAYRSTDDGLSWNRFAEFTTSIVPFAITPAGTLLANDAGTLMRSVDSGTTWTPAAVEAFTARYYALRAEGTNGLLLGTNLGLYRSSDDGRTWASLNRNLHAITVYSLAADSSGNLFAVGNDQGVYRSLDAGTTWTNVGPPNRRTPFPMLLMTTIACAGDGHLCALAIDSLYMSPDNGDTWTSIPIPVGIAAAADILTVPGGLVITETMTQTSGVSAIAISTTFGASWRVVKTDPEGQVFHYQYLPNGRVAAGLSKGFRYSLDSGATWERRSTGRPDSVAISLLALTHSMKLLAQTTFGLYRTADEGVTWDSLGKPFTAGAVYRIVTLRNGRLLALASTTIYVSDDEGRTWTAVKVDGFPLTVLAQSASGEIYAGSAGHGLFRLAGPAGVPSSADAPRTLIEQALAADGSLHVVYAAGLPGVASLGLFDIRGRAVAAATAVHEPAGRYAADIAVGALPSGCYILRLEIGGRTASFTVPIVR